MGSILIKTEIPGPKSKEIGQKRAKYVASAMESFAPFYIKKGHGAVVEDADGNRFLDFIGGWGCLIVGHTPERIVNAIKSIPLVTTDEQLNEGLDVLDRAIQTLTK